jgi:hypothetical protein
MVEHADLKLRHEQAVGKLEGQVLRRMVASQPDC